MSKYFFSVFLGIALLSFGAGYGFELDNSVDEEIRQYYNPSKLENDVLPDLPKNLQDIPTQPVTRRTVGVQTPTENNVPKNNIETEFSKTRGKVSNTQISSGKSDDYAAVKIKKGTKFKVQSQTKVSDWNGVGARMTFVSTAPVTSRYISIPTGTTIHAVVSDVHQPNLAGNGGLLKLNADTITLNGNMVNLNAKVIRANNKIVINNNIKGKRTYWKNVGKQVDKGQNFYNKTRRISSKLSNNPIGLIISPVPTLVGAVGYTGNLVISPIVGLWAKGEHIVLPSGTPYTLKLKENVYLY